MTHTELIEQIRQGTPLENDIDDVELLNKVIQEASHPICEATGRYKFYYLNGDYWCSTDEQKPNAIKLSAFKTKIWNVDELLRFVDYKESMADFSIATDTLRAFLLNPELLANFLNSKGI